VVFWFSCVLARAKTKEHGFMTESLRLLKHGARDGTFRHGDRVLGLDVETNRDLEGDMRITLQRTAGTKARLLLLLSLIPGAVAAQQPKMNMVKIADDVYTMVEAGGSSNSTFIAFESRPAFDRTRS
jgi:hypothetical protein